MLSVSGTLYDKLSIAKNMAPAALLSNVMTAVWNEEPGVQENEPVEQRPIQLVPSTVEKVLSFPSIVTLPPEGPTNGINKTLKERNVVGASKFSVRVPSGAPSGRYQQTKVQGHSLLY